MERKPPPRGARAGVKADLKASKEDGQAGFAAGVSNHGDCSLACMVPRFMHAHGHHSTASTLFNLIHVVQDRAQRPGRMTFLVRSLTQCSPSIAR